MTLNCRAFIHINAPITCHKESSTLRYLAAIVSQKPKCIVYVIFNFSRGIKGVKLRNDIMQKSLIYGTRM